MHPKKSGQSRFFMTEKDYCCIKVELMHPGRIESDALSINFW
jgi:hypothetical protein